MPATTIGDTMQRFDANGNPVYGPGQAPGGDAGGIAPFITGLYDLFNARTSMNDATRAAGMADPAAALRPGGMADFQAYLAAHPPGTTGAMARTGSAWDQIQALLANPNSVTSMPGFQFGKDQALEGVNRGAGASGLLNSGNRLAALQDRSEGYARGWYNETVNDLFKNLSGGIAADQLGMTNQQQGFNQYGKVAGLFDSNPGLAAQLLLRGRENQQSNVGAGVGGIANGIAGFLPAIQRALGMGGGLDLTQGGGNIGATDDWIKQAFGIGDTGGGGNLDIGAGDIGDFTNWLGGGGDIWSGLRGEDLAAILG